MKLSELGALIPAGAEVIEFNSAARYLIVIDPSTPRTDAVALGDSLRDMGIAFVMVVSDVKPSVYEFIP